MVLLWERGTGAVIRIYRGHTGPVLGVTFSPDGRRIASAGDDGTVRLWETETDRQLANFRGHTGPVYCVQFAPDGTRLAAAGYDETVKVWELATEGEALTLDGYRGWALPRAIQLRQPATRLGGYRNRPSGRRRDRAADRHHRAFPSGGASAAAVSWAWP